MLTLVSSCRGEQAASDPGILADFGMIHRVLDSNTFLNSDFVVTRGVTSRFWDLPCSTTAFARKSLPFDSFQNDTTACRPIVAGPFSDHVTFEFAFSNTEAYSFRKPSVSGIGGRAHPVVEDFAVYPDQQSGEITITSGCSSPSPKEAISNATSMSQMRMDFEVRPNVSISIGWIKVCGSGKNFEIDYGFDTLDASGLHRRLSLTGEGQKLPQTLSPVFGTGFPSTRVYLLYKSPKHSQHFGAPVLEQSDEGVVDLAIRGAKFGGLLASSDVATFDVMYHCRERATSEIRMKIPIPPYQDIQVKWLKDCGGGVEPSINIGTKGFTEPNVVRAGLLRSGFRSENKHRRIPSIHNSSNDAVLGPDDETKTFFIWSKRGVNVVDHPIKFGRLSLTCENANTVIATTSQSSTVAGFLGISARSFNEHSEVLEPDDQRYLEIRLTCLKKGFSRIMVTVPVRDRSPIEWSFMKECRRPRARRRSFMTAGQLLNWSLLLFAASIFALLVKRKYYEVSGFLTVP